MDRERELRTLAEAATPGPWKAERGICTNSVYETAFTDAVRLGSAGLWTVAIARQAHEWKQTKTWAKRVGDGEPEPPMSPNAAYIAAANPKAILALLDELRDAQERIAKLERAAELAQWVENR